MATRSAARRRLRCWQPQPHLVRVRAERREVVREAARKEEGRLQDERKPGSELMQPDGGAVDAVDLDRALVRSSSPRTIRAAPAAESTRGDALR